MSEWIREQGIVLSVEGYAARVRIERQSTCGSCSARSGCGSGVLSEVLGRKAVEVTVGHPGTLQPGDTVTLGIRDQALVSGALAMYLLPLAGLVAAPGLMMLVAPGLGEGIHLLAGALGFAAGLYAVRVWLRRRAPDLAPVLLERHPASGVHGSAGSVLTPRP
ncbi:MULTISPECIES: SoxR reducing system RseC family protein [unclassified Thioalkalivibrio]|uniref:SoxR reducing system RseC family protein n=1 Tax=unclassified Thioalkalivibrio TaxID=2621013 RepID=UPI000371D092|nr:MULTISPECIES: SoxR reducing system RseC family protein [unclassified Thioalkalivibrio]